MKLRKLWLILLFLLVSALAAAACTPAVDSQATDQAAMEEEGMEEEEMEEAMPEGEMAEEKMEEMAEEEMTAPLNLELQGLEDLGSGWAYEGWVIVEGSPVSTGTFTVDEAGIASQTAFEVDAEALKAAEAFVLTIEPDPDPDPAPSAVKLLGGVFDGESSSLSVAFPAALGTDFADAAGGYVLAVPSGAGEGNYSSGIWWLDPAGGTGPSLTLSELPEGWVYEGWVVGMGTPHTTGRFSSVSGADSDGAGPAAGPAGAPPFPGQDFLDPESNLIGYAAVISVEPEPDNSPAPFTLKPLVDEMINDVGAETLQPMALNLASLPTGQALR